MGSHATARQQAQMGLDTLYVETPRGHPLCLWALDWTALHTHSLSFSFHAQRHTHMHTHKTPCTLQYRLHIAVHLHNKTHIYRHQPITTQVWNGINDFKGDLLC